jgi:hypothetical protein
MVSSISVSISGVMSDSGAGSLRIESLVAGWDEARLSLGGWGCGGDPPRMRDPVPVTRARVDHRVAESLEQRRRTRPTIAHDRGRGHRAGALRSMAAGASSSVVRSTDRSGFINVEIGFMNPVTRSSSPLVTPPLEAAGAIRR